MNNIISNIEANKIIAVIRTTTAEKAIAAINACITGGIKIIEITFTIPNIEQVIKKTINNYSTHSDITIGAGTVINTTTAQTAIDLGCQFIVAPNFNHKIYQMCKIKNILYIPGAMTVSEITNILDHNLTIIKLFPASCFEPSYIKAIHGPLPNVKIMPTGGINEKNLTEWLKQGAFACGIGGNLITPIEENKSDYVVNKAKEYVHITQNYLHETK